MASSSTGDYFPSTENGSSSSSQIPAHAVTIVEDSDNDDPVVASSRDQAILSDDPMGFGEEEVLSFKRKPKQTPGSRFLSAITGSSSPRHNTSSPRSGTPTLNTGRAHGLNTAGGSGLHQNGSSKDGGGLDWYAEGPGRRVGYEDMTAIDWIFEYTKERQRLRMLYSNGAGLLGYVQQFLDSSQTWVLLILTGLAAGVFAAAIDVASDWLADLKTGYCSSGVDGGHFYLNKYFCCFGYDEVAQCRDWVSWSLASHITSTAGKWFIEYFFFVIFSVG